MRSFQAGSLDAHLRRGTACRRWRPGPQGPKRRRAHGRRRLPRDHDRYRINRIHDLWDERHCPNPRCHPLPAGFASLGDDDIHAELGCLLRLAPRVHLMDHLRTRVMSALDQTRRIAQG